MGERPRAFRTRAGVRLAVLGTLYVAQGITWGLVSALLVPWFAQQGMPLEQQAGIFVLGTLPWALKLAWSPLLDRFGGVGSGRQRWFVAIGQTLMALCVLGMGMLGNPFEAAGTVALLWLLHNVFMSLQDVATDALALDVLHDDERGRANAYMLGGHVLGVFLGSFVLGKLMAVVGLSGAIVIDGAVVLALVPVVWLVRREDLLDAAGGEPRPRARVGMDLRAAFSRRTAWIGIAVALPILLADSALSAVSQAFFVVELEFPLERLYGELVPLDALAQLVGFVAAAAIVDRLGHRRAAIGGAVALGLAWAAFVGGQAWWTSFGFVLGFTVVQAMCMAPFKAGVHAMLMDLTEPSVRATQFAVFMAALNVGRAVGGVIAPGVVEAMGYAGLFLAAAGIQGLIAAVLGVLGGGHGVRGGTEG